MPPVRLVQDIMIPLYDYPAIYDDDTLEEAIKKLKASILEGNLYRSLVVYQRKPGNVKQFIGILSERDILNTIRKNVLGFDREKFSISKAFGLGYGCYTDTDPLNGHTCTKVGQSIRPLEQNIVYTNDAVTRARDVMINNSVESVPVFNEYRAVGVISALDVLDALE
ncbi:hypothetical protein N752_21410 [Desulforamulus aquiferis]|nr:CBS domain-containing protein [Desulforamulus aquiferis]RYD03157.1 hypothetical protein N752_21410 [Desulforamulus aquiferis]